MFGVFTPTMVFVIGVAAMLSLWLGGKAVIAGSKWKKGTTKFTLHGGLSIALRRSVSMTSARLLGRALGMGVHPDTIDRYEIRAGASELAAFRHFHKCAYVSLHQPRPEDDEGMKLYFHNFYHIFIVFHKCAIPRSNKYIIG